MSLRVRLVLVFFLLIFLGVIGTLSYAILAIRNYLEETARVELRADARWMAQTLRHSPTASVLAGDLRRIHRTTGYALVVYDATGKILMGFPEESLATVPDRWYPQAQALPPDSTLLLDDPDDPLLYAIARVPTATHGGAFVQLSIAKAATIASLKPIRWILYTGMFITLALVLVVVVGVARRITRPLRRLEEQADRIAAGDWDQPLALRRRDEFGALARHLNAMVERLRDEARRLKAHNERQAQFTADVAHELRTPLHGLQATLELLEHPGLPAESRAEHLRGLRAQAERLTFLVEDLLTLQRADADPNFLQLQAFDLSAIVRDTAAATAAEAQARGMEICMQLPSGANVLADPRRIAQVVANLLSNAVRYGTPNSPIHVRLEESPSAIAVCVENTGPELPPEVQDRLFDRFTRTDTARDRVGGGAGLGLAIVQAILSRHGSSISLRSANGQTHFCFALQRA